MRQWLITLRKSRNMTQKEVATVVGVDRTYINKIESGASKPSTDVAQKLGTLLGFEWTIFFDARGEFYAPNVSEEHAATLETA